MIEFCILWRSRSIRVPMCSQNRFYWLQLINYHILSLAELNDTSFAFRSDEFAKKRRRLMLKPTKQYRQVFGTIQSIAWRDEQLYGKLQFRYLEGTSVTSCKLACETIWKHISSKRLDWRKIAYINNFKWIKWMPPRLFRMSAKCLWNVQKAFMAATDSHNENVKQYATTWMNRLYSVAVALTHGFIRHSVRHRWHLATVSVFFPSSRNLECGMRGMLECNTCNIHSTSSTTQPWILLYNTLSRPQTPDINLRNFHVTFYFSENIHKKIKCENRSDRRYLVLGPFSCAGIYSHSQNAHSKRWTVRECRWGSAFAALQNRPGDGRRGRLEMLRNWKKP